MALGVSRSARLFLWRWSHISGIHVGFDHGAGHPLLFLDDANAPNCQKNNGFSDSGNYAECPKVAGAVIQAYMSINLTLWYAAWRRHGTAV
jgi:hypothetical protein